MTEKSRTKKAIANAFKELLKEMPYSKITVAEICHRSGLSRKSFYYHFMDKYDLVNWIFDTERPPAFSEGQDRTDEERLAIMGRYFYDNRDFYRQVLQYKGQNSLTDHLADLAADAFRKLIPEELRAELEKTKHPDFLLYFFVDALLAMLERWITDPKPMPPEEFAECMKQCFQIMRERNFEKMP